MDSLRNAWRQRAGGPALRVRSLTTAPWKTLSVSHTSPQKAISSSMRNLNLILQKQDNPFQSAPKSVRFLSELFWKIVHRLSQPRR